MKWNRRKMFILSHPVIITKESKMLVAFCRSQRIKGKNHPKMTTGIQYRHTYDSPVASSFPGKRVKLSFAVPRQRSGNLVSWRAAPQLCPQELRSRADNRGHSLCARQSPAPAWARGAKQDTPHPSQGLSLTSPRLPKPAQPPFRHCRLCQQSCANEA